MGEVKGWGGKREGAGRKKLDIKLKAHTIRVSNAEWETIQAVKKAIRLKPELMKRILEIVAK